MSTDGRRSPRDVGTGRMLPTKNVLSFWSGKKGGGGGVSGEGARGGQQRLAGGARPKDRRTWSRTWKCMCMKRSATKKKHYTCSDHRLDRANKVPAKGGEYARDGHEEQKLVDPHVQKALEIGDGTVELAENQLAELVDGAARVNVRRPQNGCAAWLRRGHVHGFRGTTCWLGWGGVGWGGVGWSWSWSWSWMLELELMQCVR